MQKIMHSIKLMIDKQILFIFKNRLLRYATNGSRRLA